ncbi:hypothetical protein DH2020_037495 [Rehmannia glutinosa]|uniref:GH16 domain-containing protein n=1 Tax=Rehmannia glutinosa TaxID=99300 RepID=A0ABR0V1F2_REHGL
MNSDTDNVRDELDFEFWAIDRDNLILVQTNVYAHGKGDREQRINLCFSVDEVPIRVYKNNEARGIPFPKFRPMGVYSTLREADDWATGGGLEKIGGVKLHSMPTTKILISKVVPCRAHLGCASNPSNWWEAASYQQSEPLIKPSVIIGSV